MRSWSEIASAYFVRLAMTVQDCRVVNEMRDFWIAASIFGACALAVVAARPAAAAGDAKAGRQKALQCQTCHGLDGQAKLPEAPNLAGQTEIYLGKALKDYRSGARRNDMMSVITKPLSDQDIDNLAAYYAAIPVTVGEPPK
jgi:cytochrome c553